MVPVGYGLVSAAGTVNVVGIMPTAGMGRRTLIWIGLADLDHVLVDVVAVDVMEVTVVKIIDMVAVTDGRVTTIRAMLVVMTANVLMLAIAHRAPFSFLAVVPCRWKRI